MPIVELVRQRDGGSKTMASALMFTVRSLLATPWSLLTWRTVSKECRAPIALFCGLISASLTIDVRCEALGLPTSIAAATAQDNRASEESPGLALVCLTSNDISLRDGDVIELPAAAVLDDAGALQGNRDDPASWASTSSLPDAAIVTLTPISFKKGARCAQVEVKMLLSASTKRSSEGVAENHVFTIADVLDYRPPAQRPLVEIGRLVDDLAVKAILLSDVRAAVQVPAPIQDAAAQGAACLAGAQQLAAHLGLGIRRQTDSVVLLAGADVEEMSYGCAMGPRAAPDLFVAWEGQPEPASATLEMVSKGAAYVTGADVAELAAETQACVSSALTPEADEMASREFGGVKLECQAYARDGGGGSVTIYRRFGATPPHDAPTLEERDAMERASRAAVLADEQKAAEALRFAQGWQDSTIPQDVKTFALLTARKIALSERCPGWAPDENAIKDEATAVGIEPTDLQPGGKYAALMAKMLTDMRAGTATETIAEACEAARKYR